MSADYGGVLSSFKTVLVNDSVLTGSSGLLNNYAPDGLTANRANAIFYPNAPTPRAFPCISLMDLGIAPSEHTQHDVPMGRVIVMVQIGVWGQSSDLRPIQTELDSLLETAFRSAAMDTSDWQFNDIDTSGTWHTIQVPGEMVAGAQQIEHRVKVYPVNAANKTLP